MTHLWTANRKRHRNWNHKIILKSNYSNLNGLLLKFSNPSLIEAVSEEDPSKENSENNLSTCNQEVLYRRRQDM